ncbi:MAG TPA: phosphonate metabolism protein/1,5-bisphosphokinase (PRPP-forming) PhnN [Stellaceae bacterium]|nr:phosphonate metabolism protein/1,5-bisphosphokinase (PRPP-forming) PhnN [Stellaceae bacterium]
MPASGTLILVVGPSGAGKDTLIAGARAALKGDARFVFPRRAITRSQLAGGEDNETMTPGAFAAAMAAGAFALAWRAHGLSYGIPVAIEAALGQGRHVVANVSRSVIPEARQRYQPLRIVEASAPIEVLAERLAARGRESSSDIAQRLARASPIPVEGPEVTRISTTGSAAESLEKFLEILRAVALGS